MSYGNRSVSVRGGSRVFDYFETLFMMWRPQPNFEQHAFTMNLRALVDCGTTLECNCKQKIQLSNLDPGLALGRVYLFFFLNLPMGRHFFLHGSEWGYDGFPTRLIYRYGWQARIMFAKGSVAVGGWSSSCWGRACRTGVAGDFLFWYKILLNRIECPFAYFLGWSWWP